ncbi:MAG: hypothetical protein QF664_00975 [Dehalococcoidia bacterium]|jgi:hypothetical protein|nr:hypothetical protein [Dehalococcoidia bacterium]
MTQLERADESQIASHFQQNLTRPVAIDLWTRKESALVRSDRDPCVHCDDVMELARQIASLHPALSLTRYDLDKHADRASEAGVARPPLTAIRANGREVRFAGLWAGTLLPVMIDSIVGISSGATPLAQESLDTLEALPEVMPVELLVAPYDPYSAYMMRLVYALGIASRNVRVDVVDASEYPLLASRRAVTEVPLLFLNERRYVGAWEEPDLIEQMRRLADGNDDPVIRDSVPVAPFMTEAEAQRAAQEQQQQQQGRATPGETISPGGVILPGQ